MSSLVETSSGLFVPPDAQVRERRVWLKEVWKLVRRLHLLAQAEDLVITLACSKCQHPLDLVPTSTPVVFRCGCRDRELRGFYSPKATDAQSKI